MQIIFPLLKDERVRLKITDEEFPDLDHQIGIILTPSQVRTGIRRWMKQGGPSAMAGDEVSLVISSHSERIREVLIKEKEKRLAVEKALLEEFETQYTELNTAAESDLQAQKTEAERNAKLSAKRLQLKDKKIAEIKDALNAEKEKAHLNWFQRLIGKLCRILA